MRTSLATAARQVQVNSLAAQLPAKIGRGAKVALTCQPEANDGNAQDIQPGAAWLGTIEETFIRLGWKQEYVASILGIDAPRVSKALRQVDGKVWDVRWLGILADHEVKNDAGELHKPFLPTWHSLMVRRFGLRPDSEVALLLTGLIASVDSLVWLAKLATSKTVVSE